MAQRIIKNGILQGDANAESVYEAFNKVNDNFTENYSDIEQLKTDVQASVTGFKGILTISDTPTEDGYYFPSEDGTYTNAGSVVVDLSLGLNIITKDGVNYGLIVYPLVLTDYVSKTNDVENGIVPSSVKVANSSSVYDISSIKTDIKGVLIPDTFISSSNGILYSLAGFSSTWYISVQGVTKIAYKGRLGSGTGIAGFTDQTSGSFTGALLSGELITDLTYIDIPVGVNYIRACCDDAYDFQLYNVELLNEVTPVVREDVSIVKNELFYDKDVTGTTNNGYINLSGEISDITTSDYTPLTKVTEGEKIYFTGNVGSAVIGLAGYSSNNRASFVVSLISQNTVNNRVEVIIPSGVNYISGCARNENYSPTPSNILKIELETTLKKELEKQESGVSYIPDVIVETLPKTVSTRTARRFLVHSINKKDGSYLTHEFLEIDNQDTNADKGWYSPYIYKNGSEIIAQGEFNFIHRINHSTDPQSPFYNEDATVGTTHGCELFEFEKFFVGGQEFVPDDIGGVTYTGDTFRMITTSTIYAADSSLATNNDNNVFKLDTNSEKIPSTKHWMDVTIEGNNKLSLYNKLKVLRDNTEFYQLFGGMISVRPAYMQNERINDLSSKTIYTDPTTQVRSVVDPLTETVDSVEFANKSVRYGEKDGVGYLMTASVKKVLLNKELVPEKVNNIFWSHTPVANKTYYQPVLTTTSKNEYQTTYSEVPPNEYLIFNNGDTIEVFFETEISF